MDSIISGASAAGRRPLADGEHYIAAARSFRSPPVIREVVWLGRERLIKNIGLLLKKPTTTDPCFAIRTHGFHDAPLIVNALPIELRNIIFGMLAREDIMDLFSTCTLMRACLLKHIDIAEDKFLRTAKTILKITNDPSLTDKLVYKKLKSIFGKKNFLKVPFRSCDRKPQLVKALGQSNSIKFLHVEAGNISRKVDGKTFGALFKNISGATIVLDIPDNNAWEDDDLGEVFDSVTSSNSVIRLNLASNNLKNFERSMLFLRMLYTPGFCISDLNLAGTDLRGCLSDYGMCVLAYGLTFNHLDALKIINLSNTSAKPSLYWAPRICDLTVVFGYVEDFDISNFISYKINGLYADKKSGLQLVIESLKTNSTITTINLSNCGIGNKMAKIIADSLFENVTLQELYLDNNLIKNEGIKALAKALRQHPCLKVANLASNKKIEKEGWIYFFNALSSNPGLHHLNLDSCEIGDKEAKAISKMLESNVTLEELILSNNRITVKGMTCLSESLNEHPSIKVLDLAGNRIALKHVSMLEKLVSKGIQVRVNTGAQYKVAKANGTSFGSLHEINLNMEEAGHDDVWLEESW